ncbi:D-ribose pyranase [Shimazuella alba]|jgi:D-ribose pyranase|uniref:D-ribose pyranase n=1 Tax=Shimazuella alba TaxID=2690964 RepID=A0A6I4VTZ1_9BACL|nr:D-ribose pyranase [Shimazuella alba]MXQ55037.1 D-ribose pyranase [Shimazuella alba]
MKKVGMINSEIISVLARMGHTDTIVIADCGLPIPDQVKRIDLAIDIGKPSFLELLTVLSKEMEIEKITMATEIQQQNMFILQEIESLLPIQPKAFIPHEQFKLACHQAKAVIRTGENTPYANIILHAGVIF